LEAQPAQLDNEVNLIWRPDGFFSFEAILVLDKGSELL
jgi:hypothetical protein